MIQNSRRVELQQRQTEDSLSPQETGELRGLYAHPDNPEAATLVKKEYLAEEGLRTFSTEEKERLRIIRAQVFATQSKIHDVGNLRLSDDHNQPSDPKAPRQDGKAHLDLLSAQAKIAALKEDWEGDPQLIIGTMVDNLPDEITVYEKDNIGSIPKPEPTPLELYFMSKLDSLGDFEDLRTNDGSLRTLESILCLRDKVRTKKFMLGVQESITKLESGSDNIFVCDAGCGAIPVMSIYAALCSEKVRCTCVELNPNSARIAREIVNAFGLQDRIEVIQSDATTFTPEQKIDLLISETMHSGLTREMMVQIMTGLKPHVNSEGITLPSKVTVEAALIPISSYSGIGYTKINEGLHTVFEADYKTVVEYKPGHKLDSIDFEISTTGLENGDYFLVVNSQVEIGNQKLKPYDSLITTPQIALAEGGDSDTSDRLTPELVSINDRKKLVQVSYKPSESLAGAVQNP